MVTHGLAALLAAAAIAGGTAAGARAETAEEAVAYAFMGLADGATFRRATTTVNWTEAGASPAAFDGDATIGGRPARVRFTVTAVDPCHYEVTLRGPMVRGGGETLYARIDLTAIEDVTVAADALRVEVDGGEFCETGRLNADCMSVDRSDLFGFVDPDRHADALAFIHSDVCPAAN